MRTAPTTIRSRAMTLGAVLALAVGAGACADDDVAVDEPEVVDEVDITDEGTDEGTDEAVEGQIFDDPDEFLDQQVTVSGDVTEVVNEPYAFLLAAEGTQEPSILVVSAGDTEVQPGDNVTVSGTAREFSLTSVEADFGFDLPDEQFTEHEGDTFVRAEQVSTTG